MTFFKHGDLVRVVGRFTDSTGTLVDPAAILFTFKADALTVTTTRTYPTAITRQSEGIYYSEIDTTPSPGRYEWQFYSTGSGQTSERGEFYARRTVGIS